MNFPHEAGRVYSREDIKALFGADRWSKSLESRVLSSGFVKVSTGYKLKGRKV